VKSQSTGLGPWAVALAAALWATDAVFRVPALGKLSPLAIVWAEHAIAFTVLSLILTARGRWRQFSGLKFGTWAGAALVGAGGSALATVLFTASFRFVSPSVSILLQKLQPVLVILLARIFLGERPVRHFWGWAFLALAASLAVSFPGFRFGTSWSELTDFGSSGVLLAISAAALWALSTVVGKRVIPALSSDAATFLRFGFGLLALSFGLLLHLGGSTFAAGPEWPSSQDWQSLAPALLYMALVPGLLSIVLYYSGLRRTPAAVATLLELTFPVSAIAVNALFLGERLQTSQLLAAAVLLAAVSKISLSGIRSEPSH